MNDSYHYHGRDHRGPPPRPPQEAVAACSKAAPGDACAFQIDGHAIDGTCRHGPDGQGPLACAPAHPPGPPPEALDACNGLADGDQCAVTIDGNTVDGTCRRGPDGQGPLACAPDRPPPRQGRGDQGRGRPGGGPPPQQQR